VWTTWFLPLKTDSSAQGRTTGEFRFCTFRPGLVLLCVLLAACSTPRVNVPRGQEVQFSVIKSKQFNDRIQVSNKNLGRRAGTGAGGGGLVGGALGFLCGPFAGFCVPVLAGYGALAGGATGVIVGAAESWPTERVEQLRARLTRFQQAHDPFANLQPALLDRANANWKVGDNPSAISVAIEVQQVFILTMPDERGALAARMLLMVETPEDRQRGVKPPPRELDFVGSPITSRAWIEAPDEVFAGNFRTFHTQLTDAVLAELGGY